MRHSYPWEQVEAVITGDDDGKFDVLRTPSKIRVNGGLRFPSGVGPFGVKNVDMTDYAWGQLCDRLDVPTQFWRTIKGRTPSLADQLIEDVLKAADSERKLLFRGKGSTIRGVLSETYSPIDNAKVADIVHNATRGADARVVGMNVSDHHFFLKVLFDDVDVQDASTPESGLRGGFIVRNSEVGFSHLRAVPFVWREVCSNGMIASHGLGGGRKAIRHAHLSDAAAARMLERQIALAMREGGSLLKLFLGHREKRVKSPKNVIDLFAARAKLTTAARRDVKRAFKAEPEYNQFGIINAFTRAAQAQPPAARLAMEAFAGNLLVNEDIWAAAA